ncbi:hypothetical protein MAHJHV33_27440 [Mycobacterium avium subsp. hominissuis]
MIPSSVKAVAGLLKRVVRLGGTPPGSMKGLRELEIRKGLPACKLRSTAHGSPPASAISAEMLM